MTIFINRAVKIINNKQIKKKNKIQFLNYKIENGIIDPL